MVARCPHAVPGDDIDHVVRRELAAGEWHLVSPADANPFVKYRRRLYSYHLARHRGLGDQEFVDLVKALDEAIAGADGRGFTATPFVGQPALSMAVGCRPPGTIWVKDETGNVAGSHKGRHLMGLVLSLLAGRRPGRDASVVPDGAGHEVERLAIASCGNAALAAAVVSRAAKRSLEAFIPPSAAPSVVARLRSLGVSIVVCDRRPGEKGDPCYLRFLEAVEAGAVPFCCQGPDNGLTIEGGETLVYEMLEALGGRVLDRVLLQVGGGALASACVQAFREAVREGVLPRLPAIHAVQTESGSPLKRAYELVAARVLEVLRCPGAERGGPSGAAFVRDRFDSREARGVLEYAATHRSRFMWPWEGVSRSVAHGILDDETYDWYAVVEGMLESGGWPVVVSEDDLRQANALARETTGIDVDHTGSAGLAGLTRLLREVPPDTAGAIRAERVAVVFSGVRRCH